MGYHAHLEGIFPIQGSNLGLLNCRQILYCLRRQGSQKWSEPKPRLSWRKQRTENAPLEDDTTLGCPVQLGKTEAGGASYSKDHRVLLFVIVVRRQPASLPLEMFMKIQFPETRTDSLNQNCWYIFFFCILPDSSFAHRIHNFLFRVARWDRKTVRRDVSDHFLMQYPWEVSIPEDSNWSLKILVDRTAFVKAAVFVYNLQPQEGRQKQKSSSCDP